MNKIQKFWPIALCTFFCVIHLAVIVKLFEFSFVISLSFIWLCILRYLFLKNEFIEKYSSVFYLWIYTEFSFYFYGILAVYLDKYSIGTINHTVPVVVLSMMAGAVFLLETKPIKKKEPAVNVEGIKPKLTWIFYSFLLIFSFGMSYLSFRLNITQMGVAHPDLPYKLEPALNLLRSVIIPAFFIVLLDLIFKKSTKKVSLLCGVGYGIWLLYESYIRGSRGVVIVGILPFLLMFLRMVSLKRSLLIIFSFGILLFPLFTIGNYFRTLHVQGEGRVSISNSLEYSFNNMRRLIWDSYKRILQNPEIFDNFSDLSQEKIFINNYSQLKEKGGLNIFYTREIKKIPKERPHMEGVTAFSEAYGYFGLFGLALMSFTLALVLSLNDRGFIPFFNISLGTNILLTYTTFKGVIWGEGILDFTLSRSIFTKSVFPLSCVAIYFFLVLGVGKKDGDRCAH